MKLKFYIASIYILLIILPVILAGQGVVISSGIYMNLSHGTMVLHGNWVNNGNYSETNSSILINGYTTISGTSFNTFGNVTIIPGAILSINPKNSVSVNGALTNNAGTSGLVLRSDATGTASLIHNTSNVPATVERYISGDAEAWHFLSSPVSNQDIGGSWLPSGSYGNGTGYDLYLWDEPTNCWIYKLDTTSLTNWNTAHPEGNFVVGRGYLYSVQAANPKKEFSGNLNNGLVSYKITFASDSTSLVGFNLVGNPYPSPIDWQAKSGWTRSPLIASGGGYDMWIWNPLANNYGVFNSNTGIGTNNVTRYIAPMQGYFVRAIATGNLKLNNSVRVHDNAGNWKSAEINPELVSLVVQSAADNSFDESQLLFGYAENQPGAAKLFSNAVAAPSLYLPSEDEFLSVRYLTDTVDNPTIPVMFHAGVDGDYTLRCGFIDEEFKSVMLEDRQNHYFQDLKVEKNYHFKATKKDDTNRFVIIFGSVITHSVNTLPARIYTAKNLLFIDLTLIDIETEVTVYDIWGRKLLQQNLKGQIQHRLNLNADTQLVIVFIINPNGNFFSKLLWVRN